MVRVFVTCLIAATVLSTPDSLVAYEKEIGSLSSALAEHVAQAKMKKVAVVDFVNLQGSVTELGRFLSEEVTVALAGSRKGFRVVERTHLRALVKEHKLQITEVIDPKTAAKLGQVSGADGLVIGTITPFGDSVRLAIKVLDTTTGDVIDAVSGDIAKTKAIEELLGRGVETGGQEQGAPPAAAIGKGIEAAGFLFKPVKCSRKGDSLVCTISVENRGDGPVRLHIFGSDAGTSSSHLYDSQGNQYQVSAQIGNRQDRYAVTETFLPQIPIIVHFTSQAVSSEATHATMVVGIKFLNKSNQEEYKKVGIKNVPVGK